MAKICKDGSVRMYCPEDGPSSFGLPKLNTGYSTDRSWDSVATRIIDSLGPVAVGIIGAQNGPETVNYVINDPKSNLVRNVQETFLESDGLDAGSEESGGIKWWMIAAGIIILIVIAIIVF